MAARTSGESSRKEEYERWTVPGTTFGPAMFMESGPRPARLWSRVISYVLASWILGIGVVIPTSYCVTSNKHPWAKPEPSKNCCSFESQL